MKIFERLLDLIFPRHCIVCGKENPSGEFRYLCEDCANKPFITQVERCKCCAEIVSMPCSICAKCASDELYFEKSLVVCEYADAGRSLVLELKYHGGIYVAEDMARLLNRVANFREYFDGAILVPAPLHSKRMRKRAYNQSEVFCRAIVNLYPELNLKVENLLLRKKFTPTQTALSKKDRIENVRGAFAVNGGLNISKSAKIIVADDVMTSGATLNECARTLKRAGFENISAFAFARRS